MTVTIHKDVAANAIFVEDSNGVQFLNSLQATMVDPSDTTLDILDLARDIYLFKGVEHDYFLDASGSVYGATPVAACDALNALFASTGSSTGDLPDITSSTSIALTEGDTLNYELIAGNGVGYEWSNLPTGVTTVEGNVRKLIGGSNLAVGTYNITAKAINYFGEDTETIVLTVSAPPYSNTKSINFQNQDYMGANASLLDPILGRASNGAGSGDSWSLSLWFKGSTETTGQTIFYFGDADVGNSGYVELRQTNNNGQKRLRLHYGSNSNHLRLQTADGSITAGTWQHILVTYDGGTTGAGSGAVSSYYSRFAIYIDGVLQSTTNSNSNYGYSAGIDPDNFRIGRQSSGQYMRNARVDELAIWGSDQSSNISDIYNSGSTQNLDQLTTSPDHWWRMGDGDTYPTIQDNVGTAHFVMYNMTAADIVTDAP